MKSIILVIYFIALFSLSLIFGSSKKSQPAPIKVIEQVKVDTMELVLNIIYEKEGGRSRYVGDSGRAFGSYQIHACAVKDVNKRFKTKYRHKDMFNDVKAREVARMYLKIGRDYFVRNRKREPTINEYLRMHNGGCFNGWNNTRTKKYI
jgi:hypothetical protein